MKKEIEELLKSGRTAYSIAKESGVDVTAIQKFMNGQRKIGNMTLDTAEKLIKVIKNSEHDT